MSSFCWRLEDGDEPIVMPLSPVDFPEVMERADIAEDVESIVSGVPVLPAFPKPNDRPTADDLRYSRRERRPVQRPDYI